MQITQEIIDAVGDAVERVQSDPTIAGLLFVQVGGGRWAIYNPTYRQALRQRFDNLQAARTFAVSRLCDKA